MKIKSGTTHETTQFGFELLLFVVSILQPLTEVVLDVLRQSSSFGVSEVVDKNSTQKRCTELQGGRLRGL